jgi:hypothetical protein
LLLGQSNDIMTSPAHNVPGDTRRLLPWLVAGVVLLGLGLRLYDAWRDAKLYPDKHLKADEPGYDGLARGLLDGYGFVWAGRVPFYPLWLSGLYAISGRNLHAVPYAQAFVGALTVFLTYVLGRKTVGAYPGLLAALFIAVSFIQIRQGRYLLSEVFYAPFLLMTALTLTRALAEPSARRFAWAALWVGLANLVRPTLFMFPVAMILVIIVLARLPWRRALSFCAVYLGVSWIVILPWMIHNYIRWHAVLPLATSHAIVWQGSPEYYHLLHDRGYKFVDIWDKVLYVRGPDWHDPGTVEGDRWWTHRGIESIKAEPLVYMKYCVKKLAYLWIGDPGCDWNDGYPFNWWLVRKWGHSPREIVQIFATRLLIFPAMIGAVLMHKRWRNLLAIYSILAFFILLHAATHAEARFSEPLEPFLYILIFGGVFEIARRFQEARIGASSSPNVSDTLAT